jgi:hypothetical protein
MAVLVEHLRSEDPAASVDLAWIAVAELLRSYEQILDDAGRPASRNGSARAKLHRWRAGTAGFVAELRERLRALEAGARVELEVGTKGSLIVVLDGRPTLITGPDIAREHELEGRVLDIFCQAHRCPVLEQPDVPAPRPTQVTAAAPAAEGVWSFADHRAVRYETPDGLAFEFGGFEGRARKQAACDDLAGELRLLVRGVRKAIRDGHAVDWASLRLVEPPIGEQPRVVLNASGDYIRLPVGRLASSPEIWREALPWLRARTAGHSRTLVFRGAERLLPGGARGG